MTNTKASVGGHTPGPWTACRKIDRGNVHAFHITADPHGSLHPIVECRNAYGRTYDEMAANARLIAAAPEMLEALEDAPILSRYHTAHGFDREGFIADYEAWGEQRRSALSKATAP